MNKVTRLLDTEARNVTNDVNVVLHKRVENPEVSFGKKTINKEVLRIVAMAKETDCLVTGVSYLDESGKNNVSAEILTQVGKKVIDKAPNTSLMLISAGKTYCTILACVSAEKQDTVSATDWMVHVGVDDSVFGSQDIACGTHSCVCPLKTKEDLVARSFEFARNKNLLIEDSSSEEEMFAYDLYE